MGQGLWVNPTTYTDFSTLSEHESSAMLGEIYTGASLTGFDPVGWLGLLPDPDPVLQKMGEGVAVLRGLTGDDKVISSIQNRKLGTLKKKDYLVEPGAVEDQDPDKASEELCRNLRRDLEDIDLYNIFSQVLDAPYYGATPVELIWGAEGGALRLIDLKPRPVEWFAYDGDHRPMFAGPDSLETTPLIREKIVITRHFPDAVNPYGLRLLSRCLWPVAIKKGGIRFWTTLCERFGMPWVIGHVNGDETERNTALSQLISMVQNAVAVVSGDTQVDIETMGGKSGDLHPALIRYCDTCIARALQGQNLTNEGGSTGSYAESQTSADALGDFQEADEQLIVSFMNCLARTYRDVNNATAMSPVFRYREPEDHAALADLDTKLKGLGIRFKKERFTRRYHLAEDEFEMVEDAEAQDPEGQDPGNEDEPGKKTEEKTELATGGGQNIPGQAEIDAFCTDLARQATKDTQKTREAVLKAIFGAKDYPDAAQRLLELFPDLTQGDFESLMERAEFNASLFGIYAEKEESNG